MTMNPSEKRRENRLRRMAGRKGLRRVKSRARTWSDPSYGGYMLVDAYYDYVVAGASPVPYFLSLDEIDSYLQEEADA